MELVCATCEDYKGALDLSDKPTEAQGERRRKLTGVGPGSKQSLGEDRW